MIHRCAKRSEAKCSFFEREEDLAAKDIFSSAHFLSVFRVLKGKGKSSLPGSLFHIKLHFLSPNIRFYYSSSLKSDLLGLWEVVNGLSLCFLSFFSERDP